MPQLELTEMIAVEGTEAFLRRVADALRTANYCQQAQIAAQEIEEMLDWYFQAEVEVLDEAI